MLGKATRDKPCDTQRFSCELLSCILTKRPHLCFFQGMKEFKCEVCSREFTLPANLKRHMLIHASVRPFQCHICFKTFVQKQTLKTHMIVHLPVKPFKCKVSATVDHRIMGPSGRQQRGVPGR